MGAWGAGSFENDTALDFVDEIDSVQVIAAAFDGSDWGALIDADCACRIVVAAECVAAMRGHRSKSMPDGLAKIVDDLGKPSAELLDLARDSVSAVVSYSELTELWADAEESGDFNRAITELIDRLSKSEQPASKLSTPKPQSNPSPCLFCDEPMGTEFSAIDITLNADQNLGMSHGGSTHLACLNAALHPKHIIQNWNFDDAEIDAMADKLLRGEALGPED